MSQSSLSLLTIASFIFFCVLLESLRQERLRNVRIPQWTTGRFALLEFTKLIISLAIHFWRRRHPSARPRETSDQEQPLSILSPQGSGRSSPEWNTPVSSGHRSGINAQRSTLYITGVAGLYALQGQLFLKARFLTDPIALYLAIPVATLLSLIILRVFFARSFLPLHWHSVLLQLCGLFIIRTTIIHSNLPHSSISLIFALSLSTSFALVSTDIIYRLHDASPPTSINIILFACGTILNAGLALVQEFGTIADTYHLNKANSLSAILLLAEAGRDIAALSIISYFDAVLVGVAAALGSGILLFACALISWVYSIVLLAGCLAVLIGSLSYFFSYQSIVELGELPDTPRKFDHLRHIAGISLASIFLLFSLQTSFKSVPQATQSRHTSVWDALSTYSTLDAICQPKSLPSLSYFPGPRKYHAFDNVLLIVFFSHARYNVNLDNYKQVYAKFFPNMIFIGPASRQDAGFEHSYDVLVDSYEADEDLNDPTFYKMAGRMAHHMLYTAMRQYDCYDGYLWAPFDTLLNIPRLQQFDQRYFWYHSPWGKYVPNPAFKRMEDNENKAMHPPSAIISPDPNINLTETWKGWETDWWWGDPHVGLEVCMSAFNKVPLNMRQRMAEFTSGTVRLVGGSADTLYIPGRHRERFMGILGTFLETDCFLEIATPTTVHLTVPRDEPILYVDHWWIWYPPFNATFVRQKWELGLEVDTFHTFHWGDKGDDGIWRGNPDNIDDVRDLLQESAARQKVALP